MKTFEPRKTERKIYKEEKKRELKVFKNFASHLHLIKIYISRNTYSAFFQLLYSRVKRKQKNCLLFFTQL